MLCHFFKSTLIKKDQRTRMCRGGQSLNSMLNRERRERWFWASSEVTCARDLHLTGCCYWKTARTSTSQLDSQVILKNLRVSFMFSWACPLNCHMASDTFLSFLLNSHIRWFIDVTHEATSYWRAWYWRIVQLLQCSHSAKDQHTCWCLTLTHTHTTTFLWSALVTVTFQECCCVFALHVYILYFA